MKKRNYGIDFLRAFAMFLVVLDHIVLANMTGGNSFFHRNIFTANNSVLWLLYTISVCCNVLFGMVSGYLMYTKKPKSNRVLQIWLQTFFYSVVCFAILVIWFHSPFTYKNILNAFFPIMRARYWYLTAYFEMLLFVPLMNIVIRHISRHTAIISMLLFFGMIIVLPLFLNPKGDTFDLLRGKNVFGLMIYYFMGAYIRKFDIDQVLSKKIWWLTIIFTLAFTWLSKIAIALANQYYSLHINSNFLIKNRSLSPTALICALAIFCIFKNINFHPRQQKILLFLSTTSLGVYLLHWAIMPILQYKIMIPGRDDMNPLLLLFLILVVTLIVYLSCSLIDFIRVYLFKFLHVENFAKWVGNKFDQFINWLKYKIDASFAN